MWADPDTGTGAVYIVRPVSVAGGVVTYLVAYPSPQLTHANHAHDILLVNAKGATAVKASANELGYGGGGPGDQIVQGNKADGGIRNTTDTAHAAAAGSELPNNAIDLSNVVVHVKARGRVR